MNERLSFLFGYFLSYVFVSFASTALARIFQRGGNNYWESTNLSLRAGMIELIVILLALFIMAPFFVRAVKKVGSSDRASFLISTLLVSFFVPVVFLLLPPSENFSYFAHGCLVIEDGIRTPCGWRFVWERVFWLLIMSLVASEIAVRLSRYRYEE